MTTNTVLDDAEKRATDATAHAHTTQREIIETMREEIGRQHYQQAKVELPKLEQFIATHARPYVDRLTRLSQRAPVPLRSDILAHVRELQEACASGMDWVRAGIEDWDRLAPPLMPGTQQIDLMRRGAEVDSVRRRLMNWEGKESRCRDLMAYIDNYIKESGWPTSQPPR